MMIDELEKIPKNATIDVLPRHMPEGTEEKHEHIQS
jgi:hypothetical protein